MEPVTMSMLLGSVGGAMILNKMLDYIIPTKYQPQYKAQAERDAKLQEFQERQNRENQQFQLERDETQRKFQWELEANRMAFQERQEMRRLQFQKQMEERREELQRSLAEMNIRNSQEIAKFQAIAMRETQILVARENAQNLLQDHMVQDALKNFPLNISPLVLLKNRPHSLSSLLRFTIGAECNTDDVGNDVMKYAENPEALNIFVAPVYVDSKIKNRKVLSDQIWDTVYQKIESFFTLYYNRRSERPVIFYPTAWNDKYSAGMHASETLHFFLKDMPCIVLEPRFDGNKFRLMISSWGLGYASTEHVRAEMNFDVNIDALLANAAYKRSLRAMKVIAKIDGADIADSDKVPFYRMEKVLDKNIKLYEHLGMDEETGELQFDAIESLGVYNIFQIEPVQDLEPLAELLSAQIGMTLATLTDIHHLRSTDVFPAFPKLMKDYFPQLYKDEKLRKEIARSYERIFVHLRNEENYMLPSEERKSLARIREQQIENVKLDLNLELSENSWRDQVCKIAREQFDVFDDNFEIVWETCLDEMTITEKPIFELILPMVDDKDMYRQLERKLDKIRD